MVVDDQGKLPIVITERGPIFRTGKLMGEISDDSAVHGAILADQVRGLDWKARQAKKKSKASNEVIDATLALVRALVN